MGPIYLYRRVIDVDFDIIFYPILNIYTHARYNICAINYIYIIYVRLEQPFGTTDIRISFAFEGENNR